MRLPVSVEMLLSRLRVAFGSWRGLRAIRPIPKSDADVQVIPLHSEQTATERSEAA